MSKGKITGRVYNGENHIIIDSLSTEDLTDYFKHINDYEERKRIQDPKWIKAWREANGEIVSRDQTALTLVPFGGISEALLERNCQFEGIYKMNWGNWDNWKKLTFPSLENRTEYEKKIDALRTKLIVPDFHKVTSTNLLSMFTITKKDKKSKSHSYQGSEIITPEGLVLELCKTPNKNKYKIFVKEE